MFRPEGAESRAIPQAQGGESCSVHGTLQTRILEWIAFPFSRRSPQPNNQTQAQVSHIAGGFFTS